MSPEDTRIRTRAAALAARRRMAVEGINVKGGIPSAALPLYRPGTPYYGQLEKVFEDLLGNGERIPLPDRPPSPPKKVKRKPVPKLSPEPESTSPVVTRSAKTKAKGKAKEKDKPAKSKAVVEESDEEEAVKEGLAAIDQDGDDSDIGKFPPALAASSIIHCAVHTISLVMIIDGPHIEPVDAFDADASRADSPVVVDDSDEESEGSESGDEEDEDGDADVEMGEGQ